MSEATKKALHDAYAASHSRNWVEIFCAIDAHVKSEVAASRVERGATATATANPASIASPGWTRVEAESKPEPSAKGPQELVLYYQPSTGDWTSYCGPGGVDPTEYIRADVVERRVADARADEAKVRSMNDLTWKSAHERANDRDLIVESQRAEAAERELAECKLQVARARTSFSEAFSQAIRVSVIDGPLTVSELENIEELGEAYGSLARAEAKK